MGSEDITIMPDNAPSRYEPSSYLQVPKVLPRRKRSSSSKFDSPPDAAANPRYWCDYRACATAAIHFARQADLERHIEKVHHGVKPPSINCQDPSCHRRGVYGFTSKNEMINHMREVDHQDFLGNQYGREALGSPDAFAKSTLSPWQGKMSINPVIPLVSGSKGKAETEKHITGASAPTLDKSNGNKPFQFIGVGSTEATSNRQWRPLKNLDGQQDIDALLDPSVFNAQLDSLENDVVKACGVARLFGTPPTNLFIPQSPCLERLSGQGKYLWLP